jgi:hypothetical protein
VISRATPHFWELYRALPPEIRAAARKAYEKFSENPAHPGLRLERPRTDHPGLVGENHTRLPRSRAALR